MLCICTGHKLFIDGVHCAQVTLFLSPLLDIASKEKSLCRPAIAWATWDLIAMVEKGGHDGPATHAVTFVWNGHEVIDNLVSFVIYNDTK